jgi:hypothetical protein
MVDLTDIEVQALIGAARAQTDDLAIVDHDEDPMVAALDSALAKLEGRGGTA